MEKDNVKEFKVVEKTPEKEEVSAIDDLKECTNALCEAEFLKGAKGGCIIGVYTDEGVHFISSMDPFTSNMVLDVLKTNIVADQFGESYYDG